MGDLSTTILAAEEGGGTSNFLLPNGTFFFVLLIFLIVLGVIGAWVVPPISKVLHEREAMVTKTVEDNRKSAELFAAAQADSQRVMADARREASGIRDEARGEGRKIVEDMRARASAEAASTLQGADEELSNQGRETAAELRSSIETLSTTLASRVLGVELTAERAAATSSQGR
jgi:F-type H+-transporting ATPase subunit b